MTKDEILQALRLTAMGRANTPLQDELAGKLAKVFAEMKGESLDALVAQISPENVHQEAPKRTRKTKAE